MDPLVSSGIVYYAGNLFGSVPWANRYILASSENFGELLVELFWSVQVVLKKTLTKSHDYSRLFSKEKRRLKIEKKVHRWSKCFSTPENCSIFSFFSVDVTCLHYKTNIISPCFQLPTLGNRCINQPNCYVTVMYTGSCYFSRSIYNLMVT